MEDLLMIELGNQPFLQAGGSAGPPGGHEGTRHRAEQPGRHERRDCLGQVRRGRLPALRAGGKRQAHRHQTKASVRLVEVATGQVKVDEQVALSDDLALSLAAVREKVLAAVRPESQAANRLTVGIAAFPNRSGTDRSDKLGIELQKALRKRLSATSLGPSSWSGSIRRSCWKRSTWPGRDWSATTPSRKLPPADLVISGSMEDVGREYEPGKPWEVKLDLTLRLRGHSSQVSQTFRSDAIEAAADELMRKIDEFRRQPASPAPCRKRNCGAARQCISCPRVRDVGPGIVPNFSFSNE